MTTVQAPGLITDEFVGALAQRAQEAQEEAEQAAPTSAEPSPF